MTDRPIIASQAADRDGNYARGDSSDDVVRTSRTSDPSRAAESLVADVALVRSLLLGAARAGESVSYSRFLHMLGLSFSCPKMRQLCRTLDRIDQDGAERGEPGLAVLVVRESDGLPGQGWWAGWRREELGWDSDWTGPAARAFVEEHQRAAFRYWQAR